MKKPKKVEIEKPVMVFVRLPRETHTRLRERAFRDRRTMASTIVLFVEKGLETPDGQLAD